MTLVTLNNTYIFGFAGLKSTKPRPCLSSKLYLNILIYKVSHAYGQVCQLSQVKSAFSNTCMPSLTSARVEFFLTLPVFVKLCMELQLMYHFLISERRIFTVDCTSLQYCMVHAFQKTS